MAKPKHEWWKILVRFPVGMDERIRAVLQGNEPDATHFIREAVEREVKRREAAAERKPAAPERER